MPLTWSEKRLEGEAAHAGKAKMARWGSILAALMLSSVLLQVLGVDRGKFKTCDQSGFCKRNREFAAQDRECPYTVLRDTESFGDTAYTVKVKHEVSGALFDLVASHWGAGIVQVEVRPQSGPERFRPYGALNGVEPSAYDGERTERIFGVMEIHEKPLRLVFWDGDQVVVEVNKNGFMNIELGVEQPEHEVYRTISSIEIGEESFSSHKDSKPHGPTAVGLDFSFPGSSHLYGIPEHASDLRLKSTDNTDPYRLYNLDVYDYELDETMALYGSIPVMVSHSYSPVSGPRTAGVFWLNSAETWIDVAYSDDPVAASSHWVSESGNIDFFVLLGPGPKDVFEQYQSLTGRPQFPPMFSIAYHQCRWNYKDEKDVAEVDRKMDEHNIPFDVIWLDIEHTDGKRYFTWDKSKFPTPEEMQQRIAGKGRRMVNIVDPHIKKDDNYYIHSEASAKGLYVKKSDGDTDYDGWCWPGSSMYLDFPRDEVQDWWSEQFAYNRYEGSTEALFIWNDMNEPSVFNGPEVTMQKDLIHHIDGKAWEHRDVHNIFGMYLHKATADGLVRRNGDQNTRPFVLSRAFFAGSQRFGAVWTGDNNARWDHMRASMPMLMSMGVAGLPFVGADVGGFFGNPDGELLARWYQLGAYQPFFRAHAHLDTKRREPYLFDDETIRVIRDAVRSRYALLPFWYTQFYNTHIHGTPMMRPLWVEFPTESETFAIENQYLIGQDLMVAPALVSGATDVTVYFPGSDRWFDVVSHATIDHNGYLKVSAPFEKIPVYQRGGSIVPRKMRPRRSSTQMFGDPYTLVVAADRKGAASGTLYMDDEISFNYENGDYSIAAFTFSDGTLSSEMEHDAFEMPGTIERVVFLGLQSIPVGCTLTQDGQQSSPAIVVEEDGSVVVRKPGMAVSRPWKLALQFQ